MNSPQYYGGIKEKLAELTKQYPQGYCLVMSLYNMDKNSTAGSASEVFLKDAARLIIEGTHRVATDEENIKYLDDQDAARLRINAQAEKMERQPKYRPPTPVPTAKEPVTGAAAPKPAATPPADKK